MWNRLRKIAIPQVIVAKDEENRIGNLLNTILILVMVSCVVFSLFSLIFTREPGRFRIELVLAALAFFMLIVLRRGYIRLTGFLFTFTIWALVTYGTYAVSGFRGSVMSAYFGIILIADLLLNTWAGAVFGGLSILATGLMVLADQAHRLPAPPAYATLANSWVEFTVTMMGVVGLLTLVINSLHQALNQARQNEKELSLKIQEVELLADKAIEANRFKTNLLSRVSHEVRTPLGAILGLTEMMYYSLLGSLSEEQKDYAHRIITNSQYLERVFSELLEQSNIEAGQIPLKQLPFSPAELLHQVRAAFASQAQAKHLALITEVDANLPERLVGDPVRIEQIISNLVSNAIKFTQEGSVRVRLGLAGDSLWTIQVTDTGIGIPKESLGLIFEPFRQVDESISRPYGGVGLGLSIVKQLTGAMSGTVVVESEINQGSTFTVCLPMKVHRLVW